MPFTHLHLQSEFSLQSSTIRFKELMRALKRQGAQAVAMTDLNNVFGLVKFYKAALSVGLKPIIGAHILIENPLDCAKPYHLILLCQNKTGFLNLNKLLTLAYTKGQAFGQPMIQKAWFELHTEGLIAIALGMDSDIGEAIEKNDLNRYRDLVHDWVDLFPDRFYLSLSRIGRAQEAHFNKQAVAFVLELRLPLVASNAVCFLSKKDFNAHEARVCIHEGYVLSDPKRPRAYTVEQHLKSPKQMQTLFSDLPEAIENVNEIVKRCNFKLEFSKIFLPQYELPKGLSARSYLAQQAEQGLKKQLARLKKQSSKVRDPKTYQARLERELNVINDMGFAGYFLIVADFINWAKEQGIPVGPGRGSGVGSLVAFSLGITGLDPLEYELLFERFLNPERVSMPDFDIDFCMNGRDRVIEYVSQKYGTSAVSQIITYGTLAAKAVVRDVGRVLGHPYGFVDKIAKLIPFEIGMTLKKALASEPLLKERYQKEEEVKSLLDLAKELEGLTRNVGKHAAGVVIAPSELTDFCPLYCEADGADLVTQLDKNDVESIGLIKFDFLGLRTLTIIDATVKQINAACDETDQIDIEAIALDCPKTFKLLQACQTTAIFQLESRGIKELIHRLQPDCFDDVMALVALFRPGPLQSGMVDDFINRKQGRAEITYLYPTLEHILKPTYGIILYQEQVIQIAQILAGYSVGGADLLRQAMGKKKPEEMAKQRDIFIQGALKNKVPQGKATFIFDLVEKFSGYGFNKSHAAAYALLAYQTAWLKAHYPAEFMAAVLSADLNNTDKIRVLIADCRAIKLRILPPNINESTLFFRAVSKTDLLYGLGAIKGVGEAAIDAIVSERTARGAFKHLFDLCERVNLRKVTRRVFEALIFAGALDTLDPNRASLCAQLDKAIKSAEQFHKSRAMGQSDLFGGLMPSATLNPAKDLKIAAWSEADRLAHEKTAFGFYLTGHPIDAYAEELKRFTTCTLGALAVQTYQKARVAGFISTVRALLTKRGDKMAFISLEDHTGTLEIAIFSDLYTLNREKLVKDQLLVIEGDLRVDDFSGQSKMRANQLFDLDQARAQLAVGLNIQLNELQMNQACVASLKQILKVNQHPDGKTPVYLKYRDKTGQFTRIALGLAYQVLPSDALLDAIAKIVGDKQVMLVYGHETETQKEVSS